MAKLSISAKVTYTGAEIRRLVKDDIERQGLKIQKYPDIILDMVTEYGRTYPVFKGVKTQVEPDEKVLTLAKGEAGSPDPKEVIPYDLINAAQALLVIIKDVDRASKVLTPEDRSVVAAAERMMQPYLQQADKSKS